MGLIISGIKQQIFLKWTSAQHPLHKCQHYIMFVCRPGQPVRWRSLLGELWPDGAIIRAGDSQERIYVNPSWALWKMFRSPHAKNRIHNWTRSMVRGLPNYAFVRCCIQKLMWVVRVGNAFFLSFPFLPFISSLPSFLLSVLISFKPPFLLSLNKYHGPGIVLDTDDNIVKMGKKKVLSFITLCIFTNHFLKIIKRHILTYK